MQPGQQITIHCAGMLENGYVFMDTWTGGEPMRVTFGQGQLLPALEQQLATFERGERRTITFVADQAYGQYDESLVFQVPAASIPNASELPVGGFVMFSTEQGPVRLKVLKVEDGAVWFDSNHELAGHDLTFEIELVTDGTESAVELEQGAKGCGCGALREALLGDECCHDPAHGHGHDHDHDHDHTHVHA